MADVDRGDPFGVIGRSGQWPVSVRYVSGNTLTTRNTFFNQAFVSLELIPVTYVYQLPSDTLTLQIGPAQTGEVPAPGPATLVMAGIGAACAGLVTRR